MSTVVLAQAVRRHVIKMTATGRSAHVGSGLSCADILAVLYGSVIRGRPADRFIMSKGHAGAALYAVLAESGYFPVSMLETHYQNGSLLSGHVSHVGLNGVEFSTGSLGHGLPVAAGMAWRLNKARIFTLMSDGECDEGSVWEAAMFAAHHKLTNLTAIIDYNKLQSLTSTAETLALEPFADKWTSFGWQVSEVDGHDHDALSLALTRGSNGPHCVIAHTVKGKGVSFMENQVLWHYRTPAGDELARALAEIG